MSINFWLNEYIKLCPYEDKIDLNGMCKHPSILKELINYFKKYPEFLDAHNEYLYNKKFKNSIIKDKNK